MTLNAPSTHVGPNGTYVRIRLHDIFDFPGDDWEIDHLVSLQSFRRCGSCLRCVSLCFSSVTNNILCLSGFGPDVLELLVKTLFTQLINPLVLFLTN